MAQFNPTWIYVGTSPTLINPNWQTGATDADRDTTLAEAEAVVGNSYRALDMQAVHVTTNTVGASPSIRRGLDSLSYTIDEDGSPRTVTTLYVSHVVVNVAINVARVNETGAVVDSTVNLRAVWIQTATGDSFLRPYFNDVLEWETTLQNWSIRDIRLLSIANVSPIDSNTDRGTNNMSASAGYNPNLFSETTFICYARGTLIETPDGPRPIEDLRAGDLVWTLDHGPQPVIWIGGRKLDPLTLTFRPELRAILIPAGALGMGLPVRDLTVSPQHRLLLRGTDAKAPMGQTAALVAAKDLLAIPHLGVTVTPLPEVEYLHFLCARHEIVCANGTLSESLLPGPQAFEMMGPAARKEISQLLHGLARSHPEPARQVLRGKAARARLAQLGRQPLQHAVRSETGVLA